MEIQNNNKILTFALMIIIAMIGFFIGYTISKPNNDNTPINNTQENETKTVSKKDSEKDWVYDAEYEKNVSVTSYKTYFGTYYVNDIIVPYLNIDSEYANTSNNEIKTIFDEAIDTYNKGVNDEITYIDECNYKSYINNNNLSVLLTYGIGATSKVQPKYYTYNINLTTGNKLSYEEAYKFAGFTSDNIESKVENAITNIMKEKLKGTKDPTKETGNGSYYPEGTNFDTYNTQSINNYKKTINDNTIKYFLDSNGKLNIIVTLVIPADAGEFDTIITID